ncbi:MAG: sporulation protein YqfD [Ruminococcus sp.]|nr:sporulation protein YqfD [Ruminococcus sp.]
MIWGSVDFKVFGDGYARLLKEISRRNVPARDICEKDSYLFFRLSAEYRKYFERLCEELNYECELTEFHGAVKLLRFIKKRAGIAAGIVFTCGMLTFLSNIAVSFEVLSDDEVICEKIYDVLEAEKITPGCWIPDLDYPVIERALQKHIDEISWAGITRQGNRLIIDVVENIPEPKGFKTRLPSNLVACENGVIEELDILDGQVKIGVGSGVTKGDIVVGGEIVTVKTSWDTGAEVTETNISYARSMGSVKGTFERVMTFTQPFEERCEKLLDNEQTVTYLNFFSADIPLFAKMPKGYYKSTSECERLKILGAELPIGTTKVNLQEYDFSTKILTEEQALELASDKAYNYEQNFLTDYEIKDRKAEKKVTDSGVELTVTYTLYGEMCKEAEFFISK